MKKQIILTILFFIIGCFLLFNIAEAAGLVPCGGKGEPACKLCHFFVLFKNILDFILFRIVPPLAALFLVVGGVMYFLSGSDPDKIKQANKLFSSVIMGLVIVYGAWVFINTFFMLIGVQDWTGLRSGWWKIDCPVY